MAKHGQGCGRHVLTTINACHPGGKGAPSRLIVLLCLAHVNVVICCDVTSPSFDFVSSFDRNVIDSGTVHVLSVYAFFQIPILSTFPLGIPRRLHIRREVRNQTAPQTAGPQFSPEW